ncbi:MAG: hypothetical protein OHK0053_07110 [Microscillaceae bacterium]
MNKLELASAARDYMQQESFGTFNFRGQDIVVLPTVFMPDSNTPLLSELVEKLVAEHLQKNMTCRVYEMGAGSGAAIVAVARHPQVEAFASDIAPMAALNIRANALWWKVNVQVFEGSLYDQTPEGQFDLIFWNIPFFREDPGGIEEIKFRAGFDPEYRYLRTFLAATQAERLAPGGKVLLAVDEDMCDRPLIHQLIEENGFQWQVYESRLIHWGQMPVQFAYLLLERAKA